MKSLLIQFAKDGRIFAKRDWWDHVPRENEFVYLVNPIDEKSTLYKVLSVVWSQLDKPDQQQIVTCGVQPWSAK